MVGLILHCESKRTLFFCCIKSVSPNVDRFSKFLHLLTRQQLIVKWSLKVSPHLKRFARPIIPREILMFKNRPFVKTVNGIGMQELVVQNSCCKYLSGDVGIISFTDEEMCSQRTHRGTQQLGRPCAHASAADVAVQRVRSLWSRSLRASDRKSSGDEIANVNFYAK